MSTRRRVLVMTMVISLFVAAQLGIGCAGKSGQATESADNAKPDSTAVAYVCPMHPEVTGKEGDTCSKCGMKLIAAKTNDTTEHSHE